MKRPALQNNLVVVLRMAFRARKVLGTFEKRAPDLCSCSDDGDCENQQDDHHQNEEEEDECDE